MNIAELGMGWLCSSLYGQDTTHQAHNLSYWIAWTYGSSREHEEDIGSEEESESSFLLPSATVALTSGSSNKVVPEISRVASGETGNLGCSSKRAPVGTSDHSPAQKKGKITKKESDKKKGAYLCIQVDEKLEVCHCAGRPFRRIPLISSTGQRPDVTKQPRCTWLVGFICPRWC